VLDRLGDVQLALRDEALVGWLLSSAAGSNPIAERLLGIDGDACRRRWFYFIPADGIPVLLAHRAELGRFPNLPGDVIAFASWPELRGGLDRTLPSRGPVAMEYSPMGVDPEIGRVDAGTLELVRSYGPVVTSSESLARRLAARWSDADLNAHVASAAAIETLFDEVFAWLGEQIVAGHPPTERRLIGRIVELAETAGLSLPVPPRVATGPNTRDPTYRPSKATDRSVGTGDLVQITLTAKLSGGASAEASDVGYVGDVVTSEIDEAHAILRRAVEAATALIRTRLLTGRRVLGFEIDRAARDVLVGAGLGAQAVHRMGHGLSVDGGIAPGAQLDGLEMYDTRPVEAGYVFVLHPAFYREAWGMRLSTCFHVDREGKLHVAPALRSGPRLLRSPDGD
jgi:Xaa-Pro aminopeptidase